MKRFIDNSHERAGALCVRAWSAARMGAFTIEQRSYYLKAAKKGAPKPAVNVYCNAFPDDGWKIFKRNSQETDAAIVVRIKKEIAFYRKARKVAPPRTLIRLAPSALGEFHPRSVRALRRMKLMLPVADGCAARPRRSA